MAFGRASKNLHSTYAKFAEEARIERTKEEAVGSEPSSQRGDEINYYTSSPSAIDAHLREIAIASGDVRFFTRKEIKYLPEFIANGETVLRFASGTIGASTWLIVLTNKRIILLNVGMFYGVEHKSIPLDKVNAVAGKEGMLLGRIFIRDGAGEHIIDNVPKVCVPIFVKAAQIAIEKSNHRESYTNHAPQADDKYEKLEKIFRLKEIGAISETEYESEKVRILGRI